MQPRRVLFDTNVYELLLNAQNLDKIESLVISGSIIPYGCKTVRDELRDISKDEKIGGRSLRTQLLSAYDKLVKDRSYPVGTEIEALARDYLAAYSGGVAKKKIYPDFKIVAAATIHRLDIIVSEDDRTMKSNPAIRAYQSVNGKKMYITPNLISLEELKP